MLNLGQMNQLTVHVVDGDGAWLQADHEQVLLPKRELSEEVRPGAMLDVFVYVDGAGQLLATLRRPKAVVGEFALMRASQKTAYGTFMDWELTKELLVPLKEQPEPMQIGHHYLVYVRLDREGRPIGTARIDKCLCGADNTISDGQQVDLIIWGFTDLGARVIINQRFNGLLYHDEIGDRFSYGDTLQGYIRQIRPDGKIDCALNIGSRDDRDGAKKKIMETLRDNQGFLPLHDKSPAELIQKRLGLSKKLFKKGVGGLYKSGLVELQDDGIRLKEKE